ncbi:hypothetical protein ABWH96_11425 [Marivirga tractuosa]|uniref:hypothetical protein n=1 Tax=Marivirga tractuosa TaxID=1006 RepID=UPI0035D06BC6
MNRVDKTEEVAGLIKNFKSWLNDSSKPTDFLWKEEFEKLIEKKHKKYPDVLSSISEEDSKLLSEYLVEKIRAETPLEKVLLSIIWKQGDYGKIKSFIETITEKEKASETGLVFRQFARHISNPEEQPIIDQHVLRAYLAIEKGDDIQELEKIRNRGAVTQKDSDLIADYIRWYRTKDLTFKADYKLDDYLFVLGKLIKTK